MKRANAFVTVLTLAAITVLAVAPAAQAADEVLRGRVLTASGNAVTSVWVVVTRAGAEQGRSLSADDGRYYIGNLEPGSYQVQVNRGDEVLYTGSVSVPRQDGFDIRVG